MRTTSGRAAFARVDVVVATGLGVLVLGTALPAIAKARVASSKEVCQDNFRQIGRAFIGYGADHAGELPTIGGAGTDAPGIFVRLLPYLEQHKLGDELAATSKPWGDPANAKTVATRLTVAQCPDTPNPERLLTGTSGDHNYKAAPTDYTAIPTITLAIRDLFPKDFDLSSAIGLFDRGRFDQITDGTSTTLMGIVEIADKPNRWQAGEKVSRPADVGGQGQGTWVANGFNAPRGYGWDGKSAPGPCGMNCSNQAAIYSFHPDGCNYLFADGAVRFLKKQTDVWVVYGVITRRGGEILSANDF